MDPFPAAKAGGMMQVYSSRTARRPAEGSGCFLARVQSSLFPAASWWYSFSMTIALAKDVEDFLREQVRSGVAANPSELANDVLRCVRDQQRKPFASTPELETWLLEAADQPASPLTKADFDGIRQRARKRRPASGT
jgi:Arc/MetJ-type ribon-helix-helix transcriptional regulator